MCYALQSTLPKPTKIPGTFGLNFNMFQYFDWVGFLICHSSYSLLSNKKGFVSFAIRNGFSQKRCQIAWTNTLKQLQRKLQSWIVTILIYAVNNYRVNYKHNNIYSDTITIGIHQRYRRTKSTVLFISYTLSMLIVIFLNSILYTTIVTCNWINNRFLKVKEDGQ